MAKKFTPVMIDSETRDALRKLAQDNKRTMAGQIREMVAQATATAQAATETKG